MIKNLMLSKKKKLILYAQGEFKPRNYNDTAG